MSLSAEDQLAQNWLEMTRTPESECSIELFDSGFCLNILAGDNPEFAWDVIIKIISTLSRVELERGKGDAQKIAYNVAAGPLETLLATHGAKFIKRLKQQAGHDKRFAFVLGGLWQNAMPDELWAEIKQIVEENGVPSL